MNSFYYFCKYFPNIQHCLFLRSCKNIYSVFSWNSAYSLNHSKKKKLRCLKIIYFARYKLHTEDDTLTKTFLFNSWAKKMILCAFSTSQDSTSKWDSASVRLLNLYSNSVWRFAYSKSDIFIFGRELRKIESWRRAVWCDVCWVWWEKGKDM